MTLDIGCRRSNPTAMTKIPFTAHGFRLRPLPEVIDALHAAGLAGKPTAASKRATTQCSCW